MDAESDEDDYVFYGTSLQDEQEGEGKTVGQHLAAKDPSQLRSLPVHKQEVVDEQGRRRFHGAFTGGYSAGYFNTVGSKEGWQPAVFKSSRAERGELKKQSVEDFLDEDERAEHEKASLQVQGAYDTFGTRAAEAARSTAQAEADARPSLIPGPVLDELVVPVASSIGVQLLQKMGWRQGKGIGTAAAAVGGGEGSKWGAVSGVGVENTPLYVLHPKEDVHGLGYDAFRDADEFRQHKQQKLQQRQQQARRGVNGASAAAGTKRARGVAFGTGALEDTDTLGYMEDYVQEGDVADMRLPEGLAREALAYEEHSESDDEDRFNPRKRGPALLTDGGRGQPLLLTSRQEQKKHGSFIAGFAAASDGLVEFPTYPAPQVPDGWIPRHTFTVPAGAAHALSTSGAAKPPPPPPADPDLRREIDTLAAQVARSGHALEELAVQQAALPGGHYRFLVTGEGLAYYHWRLHRIRTALTSAGATQTPKPAGADAADAAAGGAPGRRGLSIEERMELLGEQPLPSTSAAAAAAAAAPSAPPSRQVVSHVANADRQRLAAALGSTFVRGEAQDMDQASQQAQEAVAGLRRLPPRPPLAGTSQQALPAAAAAFLAGASGRFEGGSSAATAVLQPDTAGVMQHGVVSAATARLQAPIVDDRPVRTFQDWRPAPLLCKRFNVPDPYKGKAAPQEASRFKTDHLTLPETAAVAASAAALAALAASLEFPPPPHQEPQPAAAVPSVYPPPPDMRPSTDMSAKAGARGGGDDGKDAAAMALDIIGELEREFAAEEQMGQQQQQDQQQQQLLSSSLEAAAGGDEHGAGTAGTAPEQELVAVAQDRPLDLFKALFEAESSEEEEEQVEEQAEPPKQQQGQQQQQQGNGAGTSPSSAGHALSGATPAAAATAKGLADAFLRARERAASGADAGTSAAAAISTPGIQLQQTPEERRRQEILDALRSLKKGSKSSKHKKKHKRQKDEHNPSSKKRRKGEKESSSKKRKRDRHKEGDKKQAKRRSSRRDSPGGSSASSSDGGSSDSSGDSSS